MRGRASQIGADIPALTGVRGIAALFVVLYHLAYAGLPGKVSFHPLPGYLAVDLFFVLSGFLMAHSYSGMFMAQSWRSAYLSFWKKRIARIYPVYAVLTLAFFFATRTHILSGTIYLRSLIVDALMIQNWGVGYINQQAATNIIGVAWSISVEAFAYLLFPLLLAFTIFRSARLAGIAAVIGFAGVVFVAAHPGVRGPLDISYHSWDAKCLIRCVCEFTIGLVAWRVWTKSNLPARAPTWLEAAVTVVIAVLCFVPKSDVMIVALIPVLIVLLATSRGPVSWFLSQKIPVWLGMISYSLYLFHGQFTGYASDLTALLAKQGIAFPGLIARALFVVFFLVVADQLYKVVEKPARIWLRDRFDGQSPPPMATEPAAP